jgi:DNA primase
MLTVNSIPIMQDMSTVLNTLKSQLAARGIIRFHIFRESGHNIMTNCPFHSGGQERKPSFGVDVNTGACNCFACGYKGTLNDVISRLFGYDDNGQFGNKWLTSNFITLSVEQREPIKLDFGRKIECKQIKYVSYEELDEYRYIHPYMYERGLTDELIEKFDIGYDYKTQCITFPVNDLQGRCLFVARRSVNTKYFNYPADVEKPVWAADIILKENHKKVVITESFFNALTCWRYNMPAVSLIGTGSSEQYEILKKLPVREYILGLDPDNAGYRASDKLRSILGKKFIVTQFDIPPNKDINDLGADVQNLQKLF